MPENERGRPVRSQDLLRRFSEESRRLVQAEETIRETREAVRQTQLALRASRPNTPSGRAASEEPGVAYLEPFAGQGASRVGPFLTATRVHSDPVWAGAPTGTGAIRALQEGEVWAETSTSAQETFEARVHPERLVRYNEVLVPHVAGKVWIRLHHDQGQDEYGPYEESRLIRLPNPARFNGRLEIESKSFSSYSGDYIHTLGGLEFRMSDWINQWEATATFTAPQSGTVELQELSAHPSGRSLSFDVEGPGGASRSKQESVSEGEELVLRASGVDPTESISFLKVKYRYS